MKTRKTQSSDNHIASKRELSFFMKISTGQLHEQYENNNSHICIEIQKGQFSHSK